MMKKITKVDFYNYKAFYSTTENAYTLDLSGGKNLLIYGENGSGKSSIFEGLKDFFRSSVDDLEFNQNKFSEGSIPKEPYIEVQFSDESSSFYFSTDDYKSNTKSSTFIRDVNKVKAFISYKDLLRTHFIHSDSSELNLFPLLFDKNGILSNIKTPLLKDGANNEISFSEYWSNIFKILDASDTLGIMVIGKEYWTGIELFEEAVNKFLIDITDLINLFLEYFDKNLLVDEIKIEINKTGLVSESDKIEFMKPVIIPKLKFLGIDVPEYYTFLNEARLTALAISIYLAAIESNPKNKYQILFFDDIFIGLDTSNRIPLLNIIKENLVDKYQIIITTYDRYWFEIAKEQLGNQNWHTAEMYVKENANNFQPVIIQPSNDYYELANKYFDANDYPACGNYQRKACEEWIKQFIPRNMQLQENEDGTVNEVNDLGTLFNALKKYLVANSLDITHFRDFGLYKRLVLNKLSHDDLKSPYYKAELEKMFSILDELRKLKREIILKTDEYIYFETTDTSGQAFKFDIKAKDNLVLLSQGTIKKFQKCIFSTVNKHTNGVRVDFPSDDADLSTVYKKICHHLGITPNTNIYNQFKDKNGKLLSSF